MHAKFRLLLESSWLLALLVSSAAIGQDASTNGSDAASKLESRVFSGLAELAIVRSEVLRKYSFFASGEMTVSRPADRVAVYPFFMIRTEDHASDFEYLAFGEVRLVEYSNNPTDSQSWTEYLRKQKPIKSRQGPINQRGYERPREGEDGAAFRERIGLNLKYFEPFDDIVLVANTICSAKENGGAAERLFVTQCEFAGAQLSVQDQIVSTWTISDHEGDYTIKLYQSAANDDLPVRVEYTMKGKHYDFSSTTTVRWKKRGRHWVPIFIDASCPTNGSKSGIDQRWLITVDWLIGEEVPADFLTTDLPDQREPYRQKFDAAFAHFDEAGNIVMPSWETPAEIDKAYRLPAAKEK